MISLSYVKEDKLEGTETPGDRFAEEVPYLFAMIRILLFLKVIHQLRVFFNGLNVI
jgi:hypothetical protein